MNRVIQGIRNYCLKPGPTELLASLKSMVKVLVVFVRSHWLGVVKYYDLSVRFDGSVRHERCQIHMH